MLACGCPATAEEICASVTVCPESLARVMHDLVNTQPDMVYDMFRYHHGPIHNVRVAGYLVSARGDVHVTDPTGLLR